MRHAAREAGGGRSMEGIPRDARHRAKRTETSRPRISPQSIADDARHVVSRSLGRAFQQRDPIVDKPGRSRLEDWLVLKRTSRRALVARDWENETISRDVCVRFLSTLNSGCLRCEPEHSSPFVVAALNIYLRWCRKIVHLPMSIGVWLFGFVAWHVVHGALN